LTISSDRGTIICPQALAGFSLVVAFELSVQYLEQVAGHQQFLWIDELPEFLPGRGKDHPHAKGNRLSQDSCLYYTLQPSSKCQNFCKS
jgi:hypothetical protein